MKSSYLTRLYQEISTSFYYQKEYLNTVYEILSSLDLIINEEIEESGVIERLIRPDRVISFKVNWVDRNGITRTNVGYRVQFNNAIGPYKGGLRFDPSVNESVLKFLALEQTFKNSLTTLPLGGGKGGSDFSPKGKTEAEIRNFTEAFMQELVKYIDYDIDVPAGDLGVSAREIGYLYGAYKKITGRSNGALTGKDVSYGGSLVRKEATGYGLCYFTDTLLKTYFKTTFKGKRVVISGSGNVALYAMEKAISLGGIVVAISDSSGYIYDEKGLDFSLVKEIKEKKRDRISAYLDHAKDVQFFPDSKGIWTIKAEIYLPCAMEGEISLEEAKLIVKNDALCVAEGANMPTSLEAIEFLVEHKVVFAPGKASNAGGVLVSGFEMMQNANFSYLSYNELDKKLRESMEKIFEMVHEASLAFNPYNLLIGANIAAFKRLYEANRILGY